MRRSTNGGMRIVPKERLLELIPEDARRVGLVGAAVSDHPKIVEIVRDARRAGLRGRPVPPAARPADRRVRRRAAARRATRRSRRRWTARASGSARRSSARPASKHLERAAELARQHGMQRLKLYLMVGVPGETDADIDECVAFVTELSRIVPVALGIAPFVPEAQHAARRRAVRRDRRRRTSGSIGCAAGCGAARTCAATSARWAWVEAVLAARRRGRGRAVLQAVHAGGSFRDYERAFEKIKRPEPPRRQSLPLLAAG